MNAIFYRQIPENVTAYDFCGKAFKTMESLLRTGNVDEAPYSDFNVTGDGRIVTFVLDMNEAYFDGELEIMQAQVEHDLQKVCQATLILLT